MKTDYSCFLHAGEDGRIWWRLEDAIKLGAGYIPVTNDDHNLVPVLRPPNQRVRVNERTLIGAFSDERLAMVRPKVLDRDGSRLVDASDFLGWLSQYVAQTQAEIPFPDDLVRAVRRAAGAAVKKEEVPPSFESLTAALSGWFGEGLSGLPPSLSDRVREDLWPLPWDRLSAEQREDAAKQWDYQNDPAREAERQAGWDLVARRWEVEAKIREWERVGAGTAGDLTTKEARLAELRDEITAIDLAEKRMVGSERSGKVRRGDFPDEPASNDEDFEYVAYPRAMKRLRERLNATPQEVAAWLFFSETPGGLVAYTNANELDPPPKFGFSDTEGDDYVSPLMACWFRRGDIEAFEPDERYITGKALIERWGQHPDIDPRAFVLAKIRESRLLDLHPGWGRTRPTWLGQESSDPLEGGLFALSHVQEIEAEDFGADEGTEEFVSGSCQPVSADLIRQNFRVITDPVDNDSWWKGKMSEAKRYGLLECRVGEARRGSHGGSLWRPDMIAGWLVDRHTKGKDGLAGDDARKALMRFPGCDDIAEQMFPQDE